MLSFLRNHWQDLGLGFALILLVLLPQYSGGMTPLSVVLWINLVALFLHQFEEYRFPGYFPGMINQVMFKSDQPDRFPLNTNTALIVNLTVGWLAYALAAVFAEQAVWLGIGVILVSVGNFIAHTFIFNIKGRTYYNPGMVTSIVLFLPISVYFFYLLISLSTATPLDFVIGIALGIVLNAMGILKMIDWLKDKDTRFVFPSRYLLKNKN
jgi:hypothetical protein